MLLKEIKVGQQGRIVKLLSDDTYCRRLCEMGFLPGTTFVIKHRAPLGYPISLEIRGYEVIVGAHDASIIEVEKVEKGERTENLNNVEKAEKAENLESVEK